MKNQRDVILNVMFLRYSGAGIAGRYNFNLVDYGVSPSLARSHDQFLAARGDPGKIVSPRQLLS